VPNFFYRQISIEKQFAFYGKSISMRLLLELSTNNKVKNWVVMGAFECQDA
jgi:hypothetical protein